MQFLVTPAKGEVRGRLLGLGLAERGHKMLAAAGLVPAPGAAGEGALVLYPGERVGPGALGKEIAAVVPADGDVLALSGPSGDGRPALVLGAGARALLLAAASSADEAWEQAARAVTGSRILVAPTLAVVDRATFRRGRSMLLTALRKPVDGLVSRTLNRPVSIAVSSVVASTPMTPNQMSVLSFVIALAGAALMAMQWFVTGAFVMHVASVLDGCDGEIARLKYQSSKLGGWLDTVFDDVSNNVFALAAGVGVCLKHDGSAVGIALLAWAALGFLLAVPTVGFTYRRLVRAGTSDSGSLDWSGGGAASGVRRFVTSYLAPLVKRDAYLFIFLLLAIAQVPEAIVVLYGIGAISAAATMLSDPAIRA
jgi:phosphatidylglycerophosphate synthase